MSYKIGDKVRLITPAYKTSWGKSYVPTPLTVIELMPTTRALRVAPGLDGSDNQIILVRWLIHEAPQFQL